MIKMILIALAFIAVFYLSGAITNGNAAMQFAAVIIFGLVVIWYAMRAICCACSQGYKSKCAQRGQDKKT
jgi:hypothetical protein